MNQIKITRSLINLDDSKKITSSTNKSWNGRKVCLILSGIAITAVALYCLKKFTNVSIDKIPGNIQRPLISSGLEGFYCTSDAPELYKFGAHTFKAAYSNRPNCLQSVLQPIFENLINDIALKAQDTIRSIDKITAWTESSGNEIFFEANIDSDHCMETFATHRASWNWYKVSKQHIDGWDENPIVKFLEQHANGVFRTRIMCPAENGKWQMSNRYE